MKLVGLELANYAQIEKQFIPFAKGLQLLVGKNNSGKSATLRFLDTEQAAQIQRYSRAGTNPQLIAIAEFEPQDQTPINTVSTKQLSEEGAFVRFTLDPSTRYPNGGYLYYKEIVGKQFLHGRSTPGAGQSMTISTLDEKGDAQHTEGLGHSNFIPNLMALKNTLYISPHRQIAPNSAMAKTEKVPPTGSNLAPYLQTLQGEVREAFDEIEDAFCDLFPDFDRLILRSNQNTVSIYPRLVQENLEIPIERCGSGLEQALVILAALYQPVFPGLLLIDEPHNFLHPDAERKLAMRLLQSTQRVIVATHSPVMINSVPPGQLIRMETPGTDYETYRKRPIRAVSSEILSSIGFRSSDALFHDRLIFVEGESDATVLPILLARVGLDGGEITATGFPVLHGVEEMHDHEKIAAKLIVYEKLLLSIGRRRQPRLYLLDGDRRNIRPIIEKAKIEGEFISMFFTPGREMENLFIDPAIIACGLRAQAKLSQTDLDVKERDIAQKIDEILLLNADDARFKTFFPDGRKNGDNAIDVVKGSRLLTEIYWDYLMPYEKRLSGKLLAEQIAEPDQRLKTFLDPLIDLIRKSQ